MASDISFLLNDPLLLAFVLAIGAAGGIAVNLFIDRLNKARRKAYWQGRNAGNRKSQLHLVKQVKPTRTAVGAGQLETVMRAKFTARPVLNKPERRLLAVLDKVLAEESPGWRAMGQVSLGEILASENTDAFRAINSKRIDLLIVDSECFPLQAIEFQGSGHHLGEETAARDAVKKEALRRAGIGYSEVLSGDTPAEVREIVRKLARKAGSAKGASGE